MIENYIFKEQLSPFDEQDFIVEGILNPQFDFPETLDYRTELPPAWDQGMEGACSAFAAAGMKQWQEFKDYGLLDELSKSFVYNLRSNKPSPGMFPRDTMSILQKYGIPRNSIFKKEWDNINKIPKSVIEEAYNHRIVGYARVSTIDGLKKSLYKNGPCYGAFPVYKTDTQFWKPSFGKTTIIGGHAVCIVGYNEKGFIIRNSWGASWGDNGHTYYSYEDWGSHMEIWSTIDDTTSHPVLLPKARKNRLLFIKKLFKKKFNY